MTEQIYFEQADQELEELNRKRDDFMADPFLRVPRRAVPEYH